MFIWKVASLEEMAEHIAKVSPQQVTSILHYYTKKCNTEMLTRIKEARILAKRYRAAKKVVALVKEHSLQGNEYVAQPSKSIDEVGDGTQG